MSPIHLSGNLQPGLRIERDEQINFISGSWKHHQTWLILDGTSLTSLLPASDHRFRLRSEGAEEPEDWDDSWC